MPLPLRLLLPALLALPALTVMAQSLDQWGTYRFTLSPPRNSAGELVDTVPEAAEVSIHLLQDRNVVGEDIEVEFRLTNTGSAPFFYEVGGDARGGLPQRCIVEIRDSGGLTLFDLSRRAAGAVGGFVRLGSLGAGESMGQLLPLARYARLDEPGLYSVWIYHDYGWTVTPERPLPVATGTFELGLPTPEEAAARVRKLCAPPKSAAEEAKQRAAVRQLRHPAYLDALREEVSRGSLLALAGVGSVETRESAAILIEALASKSPIVAREAAQLLRSPPDGIRHRPRRGLDAPLIAKALAAAAAMLQQNDADVCAAGAGLTGALGDASSLSAVQEALGRALRAPQHWRGQSTLELPRPVRELAEALQSLMNRGFAPAPPKDDADLATVVRLLSLADSESEKPEAEEWQRQVAEALKSDSALIRRFALRAMPNPPVGDFLPLLRRALRDRDFGVLHTAAELAGRSGDAQFVQPLLQLVAAKTDPWIVRTAAQSAAAVGADPVAVCESWAERVADDELGREAVQQAGRVFTEVAERSAQLEFASLEGATPEAREALRNAWREFFATHRGALTAGRRLPLRDPRWRPLFGRDKAVYYAFRLEDGSRWPRE